MPKTISFVGSAWRCRARLLWQGLFDTYREKGGDLSNMDNMLIDYDACREAIAIVKRGCEHIFVWGCTPGHFQTTLVFKERWDGIAPKWVLRTRGYEPGLLVTVTAEQATFTEIHE